MPRSLATYGQTTVPTSADLADLSQRLLDVSQQGQGRLVELRAAADSTLELHQQLLCQAQTLLENSPAGDGPCDPGVQQELQAEVEELRSELKWTRDQLLQAREQLEQAPQAAPQDDSVERELRQQLQQLTRQLRDSQQTLAETREELELREASHLADAGQEQLEAAQQRAEQAEQELAARDQKIEALQQQLGELRDQLDSSQSQDDLACGDPEIVDERDKLRQLQDEWHEKLRKAELEISVERARVARERADMEEQIQVLQNEIMHLREVGGGGDPDGGAGGGGRWLARLGLNRDE